MGRRDSLPVLSSLSPQSSVLFNFLNRSSVTRSRCGSGPLSPRRAPSRGLRHRGRTWTRPVAAATPRGGGAATDRGGQVARLLGLVRCGGRPPCTPSPSTWSSSRSLHSSNADGNLVSEGASRLDAFSAYPVPTWLPGGAPSGTAGTPAVGPPQSSRTRGDPSQVSYTHGR